MNRRNFLKGITGAAAAMGLVKPAIAEVKVETLLPRSYKKTVDVNANCTVMVSCSMEDPGVMQSETFLVK